MKDLSSDLQVISCVMPSNVEIFSSRLVIAGIKKSSGRLFYL